MKVSFSYKKIISPRMLSAGLTIELIESDSFEINSLASWKGENFEDAILHGVKDGLLDIGVSHDQAFRIDVHKIESHPVDSSYKSFYIAARVAVRSQQLVQQLHKEVPSHWEIRRPD
ncbi:MAG: hypothetical protein AAFY71_04565 [Bacteroidota bacterium]